PRTAPAATPWAVTLEEGRKHWAFQPVKAAAPPAVKDRAWPLTTVHHFILAALESKGLKPVGPANRHRPIRRATFHPTALPPTLADTLANVGKACLGPPLACARCHDHRFAPVSAADYYALYGFFSSTRYPWPGIELDRVPKDLIPLAQPDVVEKETKARQLKLA